MSDEKESAADFLQRIGVDAKLWTEEFLRLKPDATDFDTMVGWFANAIMAGHDAANARVVKQAAIIRVLVKYVEDTCSCEDNTCDACDMAEELDRLAGDADGK